MSSRSRFGSRVRSLPVVGRTLRWMNSTGGQTTAVSFKEGVNSYADNDDVKPDQLVQATDARMVRIGRYKTRQGSDRYSVPIGEAINVQITTGSTQDGIVSSNSALAQLLTTTAAGRATRLDLLISQAPSASPVPTGTVIIELRTNNSGAPGDLLATSSIAASAIPITASPSVYLPCYFMEAPLLSNATGYFVVIKGQAGNLGQYLVTTGAGSGLVLSANAGASWSARSGSALLKLYTSTDGGIKGIYRAYRVGGQKITFIAHGSSVYSVNDATGATTAVQTGMNSSATAYRFQLVQDTLYWVNGLDKPYKYDFTTASQVTAAPYVPSLILEHKGIVFYVDANDKTRLFFTNFALYDTFTSTDFIYVPAPKSYDYLTALAKLNGILYLFSNRNKFTLMGADNSTFRLDSAIGQKGTFTQESVVTDQNFMYFCSDDGVYKSNGTQETNIAEPVLDWYLSLPNKASCTVELSNNRLYIYYTPPGGADNTNCKVFNTLLGLWESDDTNTMISRVVARQTLDNLFIQGSNRVGALYWGELATNDYNNLGNVLNFEIRTAYNHFGAPGDAKRIPKWRPKFAGQTGLYSGQAGYSVDMNADATFLDVPMGSNGPRCDTGLKTDNGVLVGGLNTIEPTTLLIPGNFKRLQRRYKHVAAREPMEFDAEILEYQVQRLI